MEPAARVMASADVDEEASVGAGTTVWHLAQVREDAVVGRNCIIGRGAYVGPGVRVGDNVKLQNYALVYEPAVLHDGVFVGPAAVLTNDVYPRAVTVDGKLTFSHLFCPHDVGELPTMLAECRESLERAGWTTS